MSKRTKFMAANWKMNMPADASDIISAAGEAAADSGCEAVICAPFVYLSEVATLCKNTGVSFGAQNCHEKPAGAYTGEISAPMLADIGAEYVILGHSERRAYFGESDALINSKLGAALAAGLKVILCVGETLEEREAGKTCDVTRAALLGALDGIDGGEFANIVLAYEPVWAIGTGKTASAEQANEVCKDLRDALRERYGDAADDTRVLYGGSMNEKNVAELLAAGDIDGGLIGSAALDAQKFAAVIRAARP